MGVYAKLLLVQKRLNAPKSKFNKFGGYNYRSCEDILEGAKPLLDEVGATLILSDEITQIADRIYIKATATFADTETGEVVTNTAFAREPLDVKGMSAPQITGASSTYARKYALNGLFCIDDTVDDDTEELKNEKENRQKAQKNINKPVKSEEQLNKEMVENTDKDLTPHGEGMTPVRLAKLEKAMQFTGKNKATVLATAKVKSFEEMTEATYISIMNLFGKLMTTEQKAEIEAIQ